MPSDTGQGTESYTWDTEVEWNAGTFTDAETDDSGTLQLIDQGTVSFPYSIESDSLDNTASVELRDADTNTLLASDSITNGSVSDSFSIDTTQHPRIQGVAEIEITTTSGVTNATIARPDGSEFVSEAWIDDTSRDAGTYSETATDGFRYPTQGTWVSDDYTFTETTTATKLSWSNASFPSAGDSISVTVRTGGGGDTYMESLSAGSDSVVFDIMPASTYDLEVALDSADETTTPSVDSLTLETHTAPTNLAASEVS